MLMELNNKDAREIIDFADKYLLYSNRIDFNVYSNNNLFTYEIQTVSSLSWHKAMYLYDYIEREDFSISNNIIHYIIEVCEILEKENKLDKLFDILNDYLKKDVEWGFTNIATAIIIYILPKYFPELKKRIDIFRFELKLNSIDGPFIIDNYPLSYNFERHLQLDKYDPDFDFSTLKEVDERVYSGVYESMNIFVEHMQIYLNNM